MENLQGSKHVHVDEDVEEIPYDFQCCVCLELIYKPVVLACGHIACFWCVFKSMDTLQESHCMVCRHPFNHFPRVCELMHCLLLKLYPLAYKLRERQVAEEEEKMGHVSPRFENYTTESQKNEGIACESTASHPMDNTPNSVTSGDGELPSTKVAPLLMSETTSKETIQESVAKEGGEVACKPVIATELSCSLCKQLLCQPVVLNCGDVFCEPCIKNPGTGVHRCPICDSAHPSGFPNVCLVLEHFLEEQFPEEYGARKHLLAKQVDSGQVNQSTCSQDQTKTAQGSSVPSNYFSSWLSGLGRTVHLGVGCDYCGICPIVGERYRCKDCVEIIGFDLCEQCHSTSSSGKLPGRFNQQHKEDHKFDCVEARTFSEIISRHEAESFDDDSSNDNNIQDTEEVSQAYVSSDATLPELEVVNAPESPPPSSNATSEHQERRL